MRAIPSSIDNESERQSGILYAIVGKVNKLFPEITLRIFDQSSESHINIEPTSIFESPFELTASYDTSMVEVLWYD